MEKKVDWTKNEHAMDKNRLKMDPKKDKTGLNWTKNDKQKGLTGNF